MNVLFFGDIMGRSAREGLLKILPELREKYGADLVIVNAENVAHGAGISRSIYEDLMKSGVDFLTSGNHIWSKKEANELLDEKDTKLIRPANYPEGAPGDGYKIIEVGAYKVMIANLMGRVFIKKDFDCPFRKIDEILDDPDVEDVKIRIVDLHAEATSEKRAMGFYLDGRVSALIGTHTHVATNDAQILPEGSFYLTDVGMIGAKYSILGMGKEEVIKEFLSQRPTRANISEDGLIHVSGIFMDINNKNGKVEKFEKIEENVDTD